MINIFIEALTEYVNRSEERKNTKIFSKSGDCVLMKEMPNEIKNKTKIGIDYFKAVMKMSIEDLNDKGREMDILNIFKKKNCTNCLFYSKIDINGIKDIESGFGYCDKRMNNSPSKEKICIKYKEKNE